ncbi:hypothetical protein OROMI_017781 [Orobanche minor]
MRLGTKVVRQSSRLQNRGVEDGECSRHTRSMKKKGRALSPVKLDFSKRHRSSVKYCEASGSKSNSDSDFDCMNEKGKSEVVVDNDEEAVRLSVIFLLFNFLLAVAPPRYVDMDLLTYAAIGDLNVFLWGKICFDQTVRSLSIAVKESVRRLKSGFVYNIFKERYTKLYKLCGFSYCFQVFLYETTPTLKDRGFYVRKGVSKFRILAWKEIEKSPTNEQLNDFVFGSGEMRVQFMKPSLEESCEMNFLDGFRFLEVNEGGFGVDYNIDAKGKTMCSGSSVSSVDIKRMLDERLKSFEDSISCVKETTELLKKDVREELQVFEGNIIKQIQDFLRVVCPDKLCDFKNSERDKSCDEVPLENACLDCLVCGGKCKSCEHLPVNETHFSELNEIHTCDAVGNGVSGPDVEKLSKVIEFQNEPTLIVKEAFSVARDLECRKLSQSDVGSSAISVVGIGNKQSDARSNVISAGNKGNKVQKVREFLSFELLSQESLSDGQHLDSEKVTKMSFASIQCVNLSLDIGGEGNIMVENEEQESSPRSKSHFDDIIFTTQDIVMIEEM